MGRNARLINDSHQDMNTSNSVCFREGTLEVLWLSHDRYDFCLHPFVPQVGNKRVVYLSQNYYFELLNKNIFYYSEKLKQCVSSELLTERSC